MNPEPTFLNFSSCLYVSGSSSSETFFIHNRAPLYSVRAASILFIVISVSDMARYRNVSTSWYKRTRGTLSDSLRWQFQNKLINGWEPAMTLANYKETCIVNIFLLTSNRWVFKNINAIEIHLISNQFLNYHWTLILFQNDIS